MHLQFRMRLIHANEYEMCMLVRVRVMPSTYLYIRCKVQCGNVRKRLLVKLAGRSRSAKRLQYIHNTFIIKMLYVHKFL